MNYSKQSNSTERFSFETRRMLGIAGFLLLVALVLLVTLGPMPIGADTTVCGASGTCDLVHTTTADFVRGTFYATGLRNIADGEVQLIPVGLASPWVTETHSLPPRAELAAVNYDNILYAIGGWSITGTVGTIYSATTAITGSITAGWDLADHLPQPRAGSAAVISRTQTSGILYVLGGGDSGGSPMDTIYYKPLGAGGSLSGNWSSATLSNTLAYAAAVVNKGFLYVIGGASPGRVNTIWRAPILNSNGDLGVWVNDLALDKNMSDLAAVTWTGSTRSYLYVLGGIDSLGVASSDVYYTYFDPNTGALASPWITDTLVNSFNAHGAVQVNGSVHVVGGKEGQSQNTATTKVQTGLIDVIPQEGKLHNWGVGVWLVTEPLPFARFYHGVVANPAGEIFALGGRNNLNEIVGTVFRGSTAGAGATYAPSGNYISPVLDAAAGVGLTGLKWNSLVTNTAQMTLAMSYRASNSLTTLETLPFTFAGYSISSTTNFTNTYTFPTELAARYLQYRVDFTTTISNTSPLLNAAGVTYRLPPTPTPTKTSTLPPPTITPTITVTPVPPGARLPDFIIPDMRAPADLLNASPVSYTVNISVANWGTGTFNRAPQMLKLSKTAQVGQQSAGRGTRRTIPSNIRATRDYTGTTNYFVYLDVYITDISPNVVPTSTVTIGNCPAMGGGTNYAWVYALGIGEIVNVPVECYLPQGAHTYYAQVDTCDNPPNGCSASYGYVLELKENNNIAGPVASGSTYHIDLGWLNPLMLPSIFKK